MKNRDNISLGKRINLILETQGITPKELSLIININSSHISQVINNKNNKTFSDSTLKLICQTFKVNENWLFYGSGEMYINKEIYNKQVKRILNLFNALNPKFQDDAFKYFEFLLKIQNSIYKD